MFVQHPDPRLLFHDKQKGIHLLLQAQCTRDIAAGEQLFTPYGEKFWKEHAPIYRKPIDENALLSPGDIQDVDEPDVHIDLTMVHEAKVETPKRVVNKSTLTQDDVPSSLMSSPVTPVQSPSVIDVSSVFDEDELEISASGKRKRGKTPTTKLSSLPQATSPTHHRTPPSKSSSTSKSGNKASSSSKTDSSSKSKRRKNSEIVKDKTAEDSDEDRPIILHGHVIDRVGLKELEVAETLWY